MARNRTPVVVAIPVKDEAERIAACLRAIAWQRGCNRHEVVLLLNNCTDATEAVVRALAPGLPVPVHVLVATLPAARANAGHARKLAMDHAAALAGPLGTLLTTDADGCVAPDWLAANLAALDRGADAVAGRAEIDPVEAARIPAALHADDALECAYADRLDEIEALINPDPADPWPRHTEHSGASIAVTCAAYHRAGGVPDVGIGEDRALIDALRRVDAAIRHAPEIRVVVSGRIVGRATGGMADTMRRRIVCQDAWLDDRLEPPAAALRRALLRARFTAAWRQRLCPPALARRLGLDEADLQAALATPFLGAGWATVEASSPALVRRRVSRATLGDHMAFAEAILAQLRSTGATAAPPDLPATVAAA